MTMIIRKLYIPPILYRYRGEKEYGYRKSTEKVRRNKKEICSDGVPMTNEQVAEIYLERMQPQEIIMVALGLDILRMQAIMQEHFQKQKERENSLMYE